MENKNDLTSRVRSLAQEKGLTPMSFADQIEVPRPVVSHIFSGRNKPSLEVIQKIGRAFPEVSLAWLLYGEGSMLKRIALNLPEEIKEPEENANRMELKTADEHHGREIAEVKPVIHSAVREMLVNPRKEVVKIVYFYEDKTFEEFWPKVENLE